MSNTICIRCKKDHPGTRAIFRCAKCGKLLCCYQVEALSNFNGPYVHEDRGCGPVFDVTNKSPLEKVLWEMRDETLEKHVAPISGKHADFIIFDDLSG